MANTPSAIKRIHQNEKRRAHNKTRKTRVRSAVKKVRVAVETGDLATADQLLPGTLSLLDASAGKKTIHANAAARTKSRLTKAVEQLRTSS